MELFGCFVKDKCFDLSEIFKNYIVKYIPYMNINQMPGQNTIVGREIENNFFTDYTKLTEEGSLCQIVH